MVLVRDKARNLRAFLNICRHRHHPVVQGAGNRPLFTCFYHSWSYALDGSLVRAPRSDEAPAFDPSRLGLKPVSVATWGDMVFVDLSGRSPPLEQALGAAREHAIERGLPIETAKFRGRRSMTVAANWKLVWDNNCECYHCPTVHARWYSQVRLDPEHYWDRRIGPYHYETESAILADHPSQFAYYVWPSFYFQSSDANYLKGSMTERDSMLILRFIPLEPRRTQVDADIYHVGDIDARRRGATPRSDVRDHRAGQVGVRTRAARTRCRRRRARHAARRRGQRRSHAAVAAAGASFGQRAGRAALRTARRVSTACRATCPVRCSASSTCRSGRAPSRRSG